MIAQRRNDSVRESETLRQRATHRSRPTSQRVSVGFPIYEFLYLDAQASQKGLSFYYALFAVCSVISVTVTGHFASRLVRRSLVVTVLEGSKGHFLHFVISTMLRMINAF